MRVFVIEINFLESITTIHKVTKSRDYVKYLVKMLRNVRMVKIFLEK